ncbi:hypothetical protein N658DRAFT_490229 [Parathielavia hyrcaniae]|uniref:Uncharacterized protein n=1 Tax=Parathielavia hyrcaniae TaxID=113614 RepID=A0AAN6PU19_9PEZI|nr:hypothetical protein N658DRAFT_490229 [Parathielavia hyrcaniae]
MPPLPSESESESKFQDWLDESAQDIKDDVPEAELEAAEATVPAWVADLLSSHSPRGSKRKAEVENGDGDHAPKVSRTDSGNVKLETLDSGTDDDDDDNDEDQDSDSGGDYDIPANGPQPKLIPHASALQLFKRMYPLVPLVERPGGLFTYLADLPVKRIPNIQVSFLMQAAGDPLPPGQGCAKCATGRGLYRRRCVVVRDPEVRYVTGGACANCLYGWQGSVCSLRSTMPTRDEMAQVAEAAAQEAPVQVPVPQGPGLSAPSPAPAPLHPSHVAALASGAVAAPAPAAPAPAMASNNEGLVADTPARHSPRSVRVKHLAEWQEDLTTRLMAMNRVILKRLYKTEDPIP